MPKAIACCEPKALSVNAVHARAAPPLLFDVALCDDELQHVHGFFVRVDAVHNTRVLGPGDSKGAALWHTTAARGGTQRCTLVHNGAGHTYTAYATSYAPGDTQVYVLSFRGAAIAWCPLGSAHQPVPLAWTVHCGTTNHFEISGVPRGAEDAAAELMQTPWALMHHAAVRAPAALSKRMPSAGHDTPLLCVPHAGAAPVLLTPGAAQRGVWTLVFAGGMALAAPSIDDAAQTPDGTWHTPLRTTLPLPNALTAYRAGEFHDERVARELGAHGAAAAHGAAPALLALRPARHDGVGYELLCVNSSTRHPWVLTHKAQGGHGALVAWETTMHDDAVLRRVHARVANVLPLRRKKRYDAHGVKAQDGTVQFMALDVPLPNTTHRTVSAVHNVPSGALMQWQSATDFRGVGSQYVHGDAHVLSAATHTHAAAFTQLPRLDTTHAGGVLFKAGAEQIDMLTPRAACVLHAAGPVAHAAVRASMQAVAQAATGAYLHDGAGRAL